MYNYVQCYNHYEIVDEHNRFVCSADTRVEAEQEIEELERKEVIKVTSLEMTEYYISCLMARYRWTTRNGKRLKIAAEEFSRYSFIIKAADEKAAIKEVLPPGYLVRDVQAFVIDNPEWLGERR